MKDAFTLKLPAIMEGPPIDCKGGCKANPTHPLSSLPIASKKLFFLISNILFPINLFFTSKWRSSIEEDRKNGYDF
jgi:hypothetical protein